MIDNDNLAQEDSLVLSLPDNRRSYSRYVFVGNFGEYMSVRYTIQLACLFLRQAWLHILSLSSKRGASLNIRYDSDRTMLPERVINTKPIHDT